MIKKIINLLENKFSKNSNENDYFCEKPFELFEVNDQGEVTVCCRAWLSKTIGNINEKSVNEIWNSAEAKEIRQSILDGSFKYCNKELCPSIQSQILKKKKDITNKYHQEIMDQNMTSLNMEQEIHY